MLIARSDAIGTPATKADRPSPARASCHEVLRVSLRARGTTWNDPTRVATVKTIKLAIVCADFPDYPFVMTRPKYSDLYGNPLIDPVKREDIPKFYLDFWTKPQDIREG